MADVLIKEWDVGAMRRPDAAAPSASRTQGANFPWDALNFAPASTELFYVFGTMPESDLYTAGQDIKVKFAWVSDAASVGVVRWRADILGRVAGEAWDVAFPDAISVNSARVAGDALHVATGTLVAPALAPGDDFILALRRAGVHGDDTYPVDADLVRARMYAA